uniref:Uncharacterized protein n=1 Tax=mine drainage metagenome TaxID=410659 RepID=E6PTT6_9ZZZZ
MLRVSIPEATTDGLAGPSVWRQLTARLRARQWMAACQFAHRGSSCHAEGFPLPGGWIMTTNTVRLHRVIRATAERVYRAFRLPRRRRHGQVAAAQWLHRQGSASGRQGGRQLSDVVHELHHRQQPRLRR